VIALLRALAARVSWHCADNQCHLCDGTTDGPGTGRCHHDCHGRHV